MNKCIIIGNLTRDPELTQTTSGITFCRFSIAVNRAYTNAAGEKQCDFINVIAWRGLAENVGRYCKKGNKVCVVGSLENVTYEKDGENRTYAQINATDIEFLTPKSGDSAEGVETTRRDETPAKSSYKPPKQQAADNGYDPAYDDDLPF